VNVDFVNRSTRPTSTRAQPFGEIPSSSIFEDGDMWLRDAQAIMVYLAKKFDKRIAVKNGHASKHHRSLRRLLYFITMVRFAAPSLNGRMTGVGRVV